MFRDVNLIYGRPTTDTSAFRFRKDKIRRQQWNAPINRDEFGVTANTLVCLKHFDDKFIIRGVYHVVGDVQITVSWKRPKLRDDA